MCQFVQRAVVSYSCNETEIHCNNKFCPSVAIFFARLQPEAYKFLGPELPVPPPFLPQLFKTTTTPLAGRNRHCSARCTGRTLDVSCSVQSKEGKAPDSRQTRVAAPPSGVYQCQTRTPS